MTTAEVIRLHSAPLYRVVMIGFLPGFPYLAGLSPALAMPRLEQPRMRVRAGSVGIGGAQTGVYPLSAPGGWRIIGRTPLPLFDACRAPAALLAPGDEVRFVAVDEPSFAELQESIRAGRWNPSWEPTG
jgi:inhibitor of KinA